MLRVKTLLFLGLILFLTGCSGFDKNANTPDGAYAIAEEFEKDDRYEEAIRRYTEVKNKFPYSQFATKAELKIGDVHFLAESFPEAQAAYQSFRELHPKHPQSDYVLYKLGQSIYNQLPSTIDRDLTVASEVLEAFNELLKTFPKSEYAKDAREYRDKTLQMLAEKEKYIADFYFGRKEYAAALSRYENLYRRYPNLGFEPHALLRAYQSALKLDQTEKANSYRSVLKAKFPNSSEGQDVRGE